MATLPASGQGQAVYLRIHHKDTTRYYSLGVQLSARHWSKKQGRVRKSHPNHQPINRRITNLIATAETVVHEIKADPSVSVTAGLIKDRIEAALSDAPEPEGPEFTEYIEGLLKEYEDRGQASTVSAYTSVYRKFRDYLRDEHGLETLPFDEIDVPLMRGFRTYCIKERGNAQNTVHKAMSTIRTFLYSAIKDGHFPQEKNPFFQITLRKKKVKKDVLSLEEVQAIEDLDLPEDKLIWDVRNWFMFSFYAGGLRFSDVATLRYENIQREGRKWRLSYEMEKTDESHGGLLVGPAIEIMREDWNEDAGRSDLVFPILTGYDLSTEANRRRAIESRNAYANKQLAKIEEMIGTDKHISFHTARRSVASHMLDKGWSVYEIKDALGHADVSTTEQYLKTLDRDEMDERWEELF